MRRLRTASSRRRTGLRESSGKRPGAPWDPPRWADLRISAAGVRHGRISSAVARTQENSRYLFAPLAGLQETLPQHGSRTSFKGPLMGQFPWAAVLRGLCESVVVLPQALNRVLGTAGVMPACALTPEDIREIH